MTRAKLNTSGPPGTAANYATRFSAAITRMPADTAVDGLRAVDTGAVDIELMAEQHIEYQQALRQAGAIVTELPALPAYPDAQFVEDTALCLPNFTPGQRHDGGQRRLCVECYRHYLKISQTSRMDVLKLETF